MIKLNNKGFAISTILYGLLIVLVLIISLLMTTMSFTRKTSKEFVDNIVDELESDQNFNFTSAYTPSKNYWFYVYEDKVVSNVNLALSAYLNNSSSNAYGDGGWYDLTSSYKNTVITTTSEYKYVWVNDVLYAHCDTIKCYVD